MVYQRAQSYYCQRPYQCKCMLRKLCVRVACSVSFVVVADDPHALEHLLVDFAYVVFFFSKLA